MTQRLVEPQFNPADARPLTDPGWRAASEGLVVPHVMLSLRSWWRGHVADAVFIAFLGTIAVLRWQVINSLPEPSGVDGGNWLAFGHALLGSHSRSSSIMVPPLVPLLAVGLEAVFGPLQGIEVLALAASLAPAAGTYVLLRRYLGARALLLAGLLAPAATTGEAAAWGGYPQLIGLGLLPLILWAVDHFVSQRRLRWAWATSILLFLTLITSDLIGAASVAIALVFLLLRTSLVDKSERPSRRLVSLGFLIVALPSLALTPIYLALSTGVFHNEATKGSNQHINVTNLLPTMDNLFKENIRFWYLVLLLALVSPLVLLVRRGRPLAAAATAVLIPTAGALLLLRELRVLFLLPLAIALGLGAIWRLPATSHRPMFGGLDKGLIAGMSLALALESGLGIRVFQQQVQWYSALSPELITGLRQLDAVAPRDAVLAVSPAANPSHQDGWPMGWWVEGLLDRPTYYASNLEWLNFADERSRASLANEMFSQSQGVSGAIRLARKNHISYLVVATGWTGYRLWVSTGGLLEGTRIVINSDTILVISTNG
jgi:hypothetical protein